MDAEATIREYYAALRAGEPLAPFFAPDAGVKFGVSERLVGAEEIAAGLRAQTETTTDWSVESDALRVTARDCHAWFADEVRLAWTDTERDRRLEFDTRWSGTLEARGAGSGQESTTENRTPDPRFVGMHVSTARAI
jgi:hypothetical protein